MRVLTGKTLAQMESEARSPGADTHVVQWVALGTKLHVIWRPYPTASFDYYEDRFGHRQVAREEADQIVGESLK